MRCYKCGEEQCEGIRFNGEFLCEDCRSDYLKDKAKELVLGENGTEKLMKYASEEYLPYSADVYKDFAQEEPKINSFLAWYFNFDEEEINRILLKYAMEDLGFDENKVTFAQEEPADLLEFCGDDIENVWGDDE